MWCSWCYDVKWSLGCESRGDWINVEGVRVGAGSGLRYADNLGNVRYLQQEFLNERVISCSENEIIQPNSSG